LEGSLLVRIESDQYGNVIATGGTAGGNFLIAIGILCFIIGLIAIISGVLVAGLSAVIGTLFIYAGQHHTKKVREKKLDQYLSGGEYVDEERIKVKRIKKDKDKDKPKLRRKRSIAPIGLQCPGCSNITGTCNLSCSHCGFMLRKEDKDKPNLDVEKIDKDKTKFNQEYLDQELDKARLELESSQRRLDELEEKRKRKLDEELNPQVKLTKEDKKLTKEYEQQEQQQQEKELEKDKDKDKDLDKQQQQLDERERELEKRKKELDKKERELNSIDEYKESGEYIRKGGSW
jgi:hypothetical protein